MPGSSNKKCHILGLLTHSPLPDDALEAAEHACIHLLSAQPGISLGRGQTPAQRVGSCFERTGNKPPGNVSWGQNGLIYPT